MKRSRIDEVHRMKFSVIIPAYNELSAICRCLGSVVIQLPKNSEVLLIDDGIEKMRGGDIACF